MPTKPAAKKTRKPAPVATKKSVDDLRIDMAAVEKTAKTTRNLTIGIATAIGGSMAYLGVQAFRNSRNSEEV